MSLKGQFETIAPSSMGVDMETPEGRMAVLQDIEELYRLLVFGLDSKYLSVELKGAIGSQRASVARHPEVIHAVTSRISGRPNAQVRGGGIVAKTYFIDICSEDVVIQDIWIASSVATTGSNGANNYEFMPQRNAVNMLSGVKTTNGSEIAANTKYSMGALLAAQTTAAAGDVITLIVTKNGTPTDLSTAETIFGMESNADFGS